MISGLWSEEKEKTVAISANGYDWSLTAPLFSKSLCSTYILLFLCVVYYLCTILSYKSRLYKFSYLGFLFFAGSIEFGRYIKL